MLPGGGVGRAQHAALHLPVAVLFYTGRADAKRAAPPTLVRLVHQLHQLVSAGFVRCWLGIEQAALGQACGADIVQHYASLHVAIAFAMDGLKYPDRPAGDDSRIVGGLRQLHAVRWGVLGILLAEMVGADPDADSARDGTLLPQFLGGPAGM